MKLSDLRSQCLGILLKEGIERPYYTIDLILSKTLGIERALLIAKDDMEIPTQKCVGILSMAEKRARRIPLSYIIGEAEFYGRPLKSGKDV